MSEPVPDSDLKQEVPSPGQKRKRAVGDSPGERRTKRGAAASAASAASAAPAADSLNQAFLENAAQAAQVSNVDLSALQQANEASNHPDATDPVTASSTAAAALGSMYPAMQVSTSISEQQFTEASGANGQESSQDAEFADVSPITQPETANTTGASISPPAGSAMINGGQSAAAQPRGDFQFRKPAVGTEEWHKLRKDNHKEGMFAIFLSLFFLSFFRLPFIRFLFATLFTNS
jgi:bHLH factor